MTRAQAIEEAARALVDTVDGILAGNVLGSEGSVPRCMDALRSALSLPPDAPTARTLLREVVEEFGIGASNHTPYLDHSLLCAVNRNGMGMGACDCGLDEWHTTARALLSGKDDR